MVKEKELASNETRAAQGILRKVDRIQTRVEHLMALSPTEFASRVQTRLREARVILMVQGLRKEVEKKLRSRTLQKELNREIPTLSTITRLRNAITLQQGPKKALMAATPAQPQQSLKPPSGRLPPQAESSASSFTARSNPSDASAAAASASGRASKTRPSSASSPRAPTAPGPPRRAKSEGSAPSAWASSARTSSSTGRSTPTHT